MNAIPESLRTLLYDVPAEELDNGLLGCVIKQFRKGSSLLDTLMLLNGIANDEFVGWIKENHQLNFPV